MKSLSESQCASPRVAQRNNNCELAATVFVSVLWSWAPATRIKARPGHQIYCHKARGPHCVVSAIHYKSFPGLFFHSLARLP